MSSEKVFADKARDELRVRPVLPLGRPLKIGSIGVLDRDRFSLRGTSRSLLKMAPGRTVMGSRADWNVTSGRDVSVNFLVGGKASSLFPQAPRAGARVEVTFSSANSLLVSAKSLVVETLADPAELIEAMLRAFHRGVWRKNYIIVYEVVRPTKTMVLLSRNANTKLLLKANGRVTGQGIADIAGNFSVNYQTQDVLQLTSGKQPIFFNAYRVAKPFLRSVQVEAYAGRINPSEFFEQV